MLCGGKNQGRGTILVSSWSEFRTKASGLFFFLLSIFTRDKRNGSSTGGAPGGPTPLIHRQRALTRSSALRTAVGAQGGDGAVQQPPCPRSVTQHPQEKHDRGSAGGTPTLGLRGSPGGSLEEAVDEEPLRGSAGLQSSAESGPLANTS